MKALVLVSGGMDSVVALHHARREGDVLGGISFDYGAKHNHRELPLAAWHCRELGVHHETIRVGFVDRLFASDLLRSGGEIPEGHYEAEGMRQTVVPFRNGIMLAIAAGYAASVRADSLVIAAHAGDHAIYPDCRAEFMDAMADAVRLGTYAGLAVLRPFVGIDKAAIARLGAEMGVDFGRTWSCYKGGEMHCGRCGTCVERREAFAVSGVPDPTAYEDNGPLPVAPGK